MTDPRGNDSGGDADKTSVSGDRLQNAYRHPDRVSGWNDWLNRLLAMLKTKTALAVIGGGAAATVVAAAGLYGAAPRTAEPLALAGPMQLSDNSVMFSIEGKDGQGRTGKFDVVILNKSILWARKSSEELEKNGVRLEHGETVDTVLEQKVRDGLMRANDIVAVGTASQEGDPVEETARAARRAEKTAEIVSSVVAASVPLWSLNLGQYRQPCAECESGGTSWQRPFVVIAVQDLEPDTDLEEALHDAMTGKSNLPSPAAYSAFDLTRIR